MNASTVQRGCGRTRPAGLVRRLIRDTEFHFGGERYAKLYKFNVLITSFEVRVPALVHFDAVVYSSARWLQTLKQDWADLGKINWRYAVVDEAHVARNARTQLMMTLKVRTRAVLHHVRAGCLGLLSARWL